MKRCGAAVEAGKRHDNLDENVTVEKVANILSFLCVPQRLQRQLMSVVRMNWRLVFSSKQYLSIAVDDSVRTTYDSKHSLVKYCTCDEN